MCVSLDLCELSVVSCVCEVASVTCWCCGVCASHDLCVAQGVRQFHASHGMCVCMCMCVSRDVCAIAVRRGCVWRVLCAMLVCFVCVCGMKWLVCVWCVCVSCSSCDMRA